MPKKMPDIWLSNGVPYRGDLKDLAIIAGWREVELHHHVGEYSEAVIGLDIETGDMVDPRLVEVLHVPAPATGLINHNLATTRLSKLMGEGYQEILQADLGGSGKIVVIAKTTVV